MNNVLLMLAMLGLALTLVLVAVLAPRCHPGDGGILVGGVLMAGCKP